MLLCVVNLIPGTSNTVASIADCANRHLFLSFRVLEDHRLLSQPAFYGSQPNIAQKLNAPSSATNSPKVKPKLTKAQSFRHTKTDSGFSTPKLFRKWSFGRKHNKDPTGTPKLSKKMTLRSEMSITENQVMNRAFGLRYSNRSNNVA